MKASPADILVVQPCVGSGFCCKKTPCPYGAPDPVTGGCVHLVSWEDDDLEAPRYRCGRYEFIVKQQGAEFVPAFGAGCCMPLFNDARDQVLRAMVRRHLRVIASQPTPSSLPSNTMSGDDAYPWALRAEQLEPGRLPATVVFATPRAQWRPGPWRDEPDLVEWRAEGTPYPLMIVRAEGGTLCGFVGVPVGHPFHGKWYREGLNWHRPELPEDIATSRPCDGVLLPIEGPTTCWWLGFHAGLFCPAQPRNDFPASEYVTLDELRRRVEALAIVLQGMDNSENTLS